MEREFVGKGLEHQVFRSTHHPDWVLKRPRATQACMFSADEILKEIHDLTESLQNTSVQVPETRLIPINNSYVIAQKFIENDSSKDIREELERENQDYLLYRYNNQPQNFVSNNGDIYWLDPTLGIIDRIADKSHLMPLSTFRRIRTWVKKIL